MKAFVLPLTFGKLLFAVYLESSISFYFCKRLSKDKEIKIRIVTF